MTPLDSSDYGVPRVYYTGELGLVATTDAPAEFPLGVSIINWTVTNSGGLSTSVNQTIYLKDTTAPTITAPPDMTFAIVDYIDTHGGHFVYPSYGYIHLSEDDYGLPTATDAVGPVTITNDLSSSFFYIGENVITWTAVDGEQFVAYDTQTITIVHRLPTSDQDPVVDEPVVDEPVVDEPVVDEPVVDEPVVDEPVVDEPVVDEPVVEDTEPIVPAHLGFVDNFAVDDYITGETVTLQTYVKSGDPNVIVTYSIRPLNDNIDLITSDDTRTLSFVVPVYTDKVTETLEVTAAGESSDGTIAQTASKFVNLTYTYANGDPVEVTPAVTFYSESDVAGTFEIIITDNTSSANSITHPFISDGSGRNDRDTVSFDLITDHTYSIELSDGDNLDYEITCYSGVGNFDPAVSFVATNGFELSCSVFVYGFLDENDESVVEDDSPVTPIVAGDSTTPTKKSGDGLGDKHNTHPTFGNSWDTFRNLVDCGYSMDGICTEVDSYHVDYTRQTINTGTTHDFTLKTYAQNGLKSFTLGFGVDEVGAPVSESEAAITVNLSRDYSLDSTYVIDSVDYINNDNVIGENATFDISLVTCSVGNSVECVQLDINGLLFREIMYDDPFLIEAIDTKRYVTTHYMNEGLQIVGDSLNPAPVETLKKKVNAQSVMLDIQLVRTDKLADIWTDQFGHKWSKHNPGNWYYVDGPVLDNTSACDDIDKRVCDAFIAKLDLHTADMELLRDSIYGNIYTVEEFDDLHDAITIFDMDGDSRTKFLIENDMMWIRN